MTWSQRDLEELYKEVNKKGSTDEQFKEWLIRDPVAAMESVAGRPLEEDGKLEVVANDGSYSNTYVVPDFAQGEMDFNELRTVAGGSRVESAADISGGSNEERPAGLSVAAIVSVCAAAAAVGPCPADACGAKGGCIVEVCGAEACGTDFGCAANACGANACAFLGACGGNACGADACAANIACIGNACAANACAADVMCGGNVCAANACADNVVCGGNACGGAACGSNLLCAGNASGSAACRANLLCAGNAGGAGACGAFGLCFADKTGPFACGEAASGSLSSADGSLDPFGQSIANAAPSQYFGGGQALGGDVSGAAALSGEAAVPTFGGDVPGGDFDGGDLGGGAPSSAVDF